MKIRHHWHTPKGSLSPILYLLYVNALDIIQYITGLEISIFADNINITSTKPRHCYKRYELQSALHLLKWYTDAQCLSLTQTNKNTSRQHITFAGSKTITCP